MKLVGGFWLCILIVSALCSCACLNRVAAQSNSTDDEQTVLDINGQSLRYGSNYTFDIRVYNQTSISTSGFYFGLGEPDDEVETDTPLSLSANNSLVVCENGTGTTGVQGSTPPEEGLFLIRINSTFGFYTLHLANFSTTGIQFGGNATSIFACTPNADSTPIQFVYDSTAASPSSPNSSPPPPSNSTSSPPSSSHSLSPFLPLLYSLLSLGLIFCSPFSF